MIILGLLLGQDFLVYGLMGIILLVSLSSTIIPISIYLCSDKVEKRIKHYLIIKGAIWKYTRALYFVNLIMFGLVSVLLFLVSTLGFKISIDYKTVLMLISFGFISYTFAFIIAIIIGALINSVNDAIPLSMLIFFIIILISGITIPLQKLIPQYYYLEVLTPFGCLYMFYSCVIGFIDLTIVEMVVAIVIIIIWILGLSYLLYIAFKSFKK
ncbi:hypothetical protein ELUCI_v1c06440 [Williamsoniiplasma lucivorax]|uniref:Uncharacterized protein n=2 Tax=Williamsoniiplasma lucivorax TaxID=209274 RepID=A0A2S5RDC6_9MOLU|nr:hypothetical protein ELUCI_v1c06440 [Williamsoniiplasma lucivorax]